MAKDIIHDAVKEALENDGWTITGDPFNIDLEEDDTFFEVDLCAERIMEGAVEKIIAIGNKSFARQSIIHAFHEALGQFLNPKAAIDEQDLGKELFLAVSESGWEKLADFNFIQRRIKQFKLQFVLVDLKTKKKSDG